MSVKGLEKIVAAHSLFAGLGGGFLELVAGCARNVRFEAGQYLFHEGEIASEIYLIREGSVALEISAPGQGCMTFMSAGPDDVVGLSWIVPPYHWTFDTRAQEDTRAISLDAICLRTKCDADPALGYEVMKRFAPTIVARLHSTRLQLLDLYGTHS
ncbi:MAG: cyclic nucleotide-binding domain-containing protein [Rhodobacteraceae bacterium]|nr:cyclic nucleotide-binding domain-containing protein [Paracoccaceae bacterium]